MDSDVEELTDNCPYCGNPVTYQYLKGGGVISRSEYTLIADWVYHSDCWDKQIEEHPP